MNYNITTNNYNRDFSKPLHLKLEPWQITGFTDGEGSFICSILNTGKGSTRVKLEFKIAQKSLAQPQKEYYWKYKIILVVRCAV